MSGSVLSTTAVTHRNIPSATTLVDFGAYTGLRTPLLQYQSLSQGIVAQCRSHAHSLKQTKDGQLELFGATIHLAMNVKFGTWELVNESTYVAYMFVDDSNKSADSAQNGTFTTHDIAAQLKMDISYLIQAVHQVADERLHLIYRSLLQLQSIHGSDETLRLRKRETGQASTS